MTYEIRYHPEVYADLKSLDKGVRSRVLKKIGQLAEKPLLGKPLGNKAGLDLTGYRKLYVDKRRIRIVYTVEDKLLCVMVVAVGKRENLKIYKIAGQRAGLDG
ncbi:MAG: addiction module toxin RelE [Deltaproteobacteria bacterium]|nr:MAG: addiction module toxin RelE [Deltaproteobacteria bacterium]